LDGFAKSVDETPATNCPGLNALYELTNRIFSLLLIIILIPGARAREKEKEREREREREREKERQKERVSVWKLLDSFFFLFFYKKKTNITGNIGIHLFYKTYKKPRRKEFL